MIALMVLLGGLSSATVLLGGLGSATVLLGGLGSAAGLLGGLSSAAYAQSYLSGVPSTDPQEERAFSLEADRGGVRPIEELFEEVDNGNGESVYRELRERLESELLHAAGNREVDSATFHRNYLHYLLRAGEGVADPADQERIARTFTEFYPDDGAFPLVHFYLNQALFVQGKPLEESFFFDDRAMATLPSWMQTRYLRMVAKTRENEGRYGEAARYLLAEKEGEDTLGQTTRAEVEEMLERLPTPEALLAFLENHPRVDWLYTREPFLIARALVNNGQLDQALLVTQDILNRDLAEDATDLKLVDDLKREIRERAATRVERIGVLLPLSSSSGLLRALAGETLAGLRMAVQFPGKGGSAEMPLARILGRDPAVGQDMAPPKQPPPRSAKNKDPGVPGKAETRDGSSSASPAGHPFPVELIVRDTGNSPQQAARELESLVRGEKVVAVIGPLARSESEAAAAKAEELGVPLISLSLSMDIPPESHWVFRNSKSQEEEIRDLVRYAVDYLHKRRFAVLYPNTRYGRSMMELFWGEAERQGAEVVGSAWFVPSLRVATQSRRTVGLKEIFERFTGMDRPIGKDEQALIEAVGDSKPDPVVDFDALFVPVGPDGIQDLQLIAPYPVTVDAEDVQLLGTRFWNDPAVLVAGDNKLEGAVFVDAFDLTSANPKVAEFRSRHRAFFGHHVQYRPPSYYTALGYDTVNLLVDLLKQPRHQGREALRRGLVGNEPSFGVTGWTRFREGGEAVKESMFFHIRNNEIVRVSP